MKIQPFVVFGTTQLSALHASLNLDLDSWASSWFVGEICSTLTLGPITQSFSEYGELNAVKIENMAGGKWAVCSINSTASVNIGSLLLRDRDAPFRSLPQDSMLHALVQRALLDLIQRFLQTDDRVEFICIGEEKIENSMSADAFNPGGETLRLIVELNGTSFSLWIPVIPLLPRVFPPSDSPVSEEVEVAQIKEALANQRLSARVVLDGAELTLGALANLKLGDVIRLDKALEEPLSLEFEKSNVIFSGYLGQQNGKLAFQIDALLN